MLTVVNYDINAQGARYNLTLIVVSVMPLVVTLALYSDVDGGRYTFDVD